MIMKTVNASFELEDNDSNLSKYVELMEYQGWGYEGSYEKTKNISVHLFSKQIG